MLILKDKYYNKTIWYEKRDLKSIWYEKCYTKTNIFLKFEAVIRKKGSLKCRSQEIREFIIIKLSIYTKFWGGCISDLCYTHIFTVNWEESMLLEKNTAIKIDMDPFLPTFLIAKT